MPFWDEDGRVISWAAFFANPDSSVVSSPTLLALGATIKLDLTGRNWQDWKITGWYCLGGFYDSSEAFLAAISSASCQLGGSMQLFKARAWVDMVQVWPLAGLK